MCLLACNPLAIRFASSGPTFVWRIASIYASLDRPNKEVLDRVPSWVWGKCKICNKKCTCFFDFDSVFVLDFDIALALDSSFVCTNVGTAVPESGSG